MVKALDSTGNLYFWNNDTKVWTHIGKGKLEETVTTKNDTEVSDTVRRISNNQTFSANFTIASRGNTKTRLQNEAMLRYVFKTHYCNNWRKRHGKHVLRKRQINKYRIRTLHELLMEDNWDE